MKYGPFPKPQYAFRYEHQPLSGNVINGRGERRVRRPDEVYHSSRRKKNHWAALERYFQTLNGFGSLWIYWKIKWAVRKVTGPVADNEPLRKDREHMAALVKEKARKCGADLVGITELIPSAVFSEVDVPDYKYVISMAKPMDRDEMLAELPSIRTGRTVLWGYYDLAITAVKLADYIRSLGWDAKAVGDIDTSDFLHIPHAVNAGLGELGKHGSLITREFGSNARLSAVMTNMPMALDSPADFGMEDFCINCQVCVNACPPDALQDEKVWVRGVEKWYVDFDRCAPYFGANSSCAICISVCPFAEPGRGPVISEKMLRRRSRKQVSQVPE